jgi:Cys-tRNA(Pro)/Cys-tRNA(Cys) deacylase
LYVPHVARATPAVEAVERAGVQYRVHRYTHERARNEYGVEAVEELGLDAARVFKTLVIALADGRHAVGVVPVAAMLDTKAAAAALGAKHAELAPPRDAERVTGYVLGGISPLGQKRSLPAVIDSSALSFDTVFVSGGQRGLEIELAPQDLVALVNATTADVARW